MAIGNYRSRRDRRKPTAGSIGAPFLGVFGLSAVVDWGLGEITINARSLDGNSLTPHLAALWLPGKVISANAFQVVVAGVISVPSSAVVNVTGTGIDIVLADSGGGGAIWVLPGHPELIASNGWTCGGGYFGDT